MAVYNGAKGDHPMTVLFPAEGSEPAGNARAAAVSYAEERLDGSPHAGIGTAAAGINRKPSGRGLRAHARAATYPGEGRGSRPVSPCRAECRPVPSAGVPPTPAEGQIHQDGGCHELARCRRLDSILLADRVLRPCGRRCLIGATSRAGGRRRYSVLPRGVAQTVPRRCRNRTRGFFHKRSGLTSFHGQGGNRWH